MISVRGIVTIFPRKKFLINGSAGHEYRTGKKTVNAAKKKLMQGLINTGSSVAAVHDSRKLFGVGNANVLACVFSQAGG
jgi:hypothetical protein